MRDAREGLQSTHKIRSFRDRETRRFFEGQRIAAFQGVSSQAVRHPVLLDSAVGLGDLAASPSNRLDVLQSGPDGQYSIRINVQWQTYFR